MSCSDKIARWNVLGLQGGSLAKFISPIYLESIVLGSRYTPLHMHRAIVGRLENAVADLPVGYCLNKPKFDSTSLIETENLAVAEDCGVCWSNGATEPEILNLNTGLTNRGCKSIISKFSFINMFNNINHKLSIRSDIGREKFNTVKKTFYTALKKENLGAWEKNSV